MREELCSVARKSPLYNVLVHLDLSPVFYAPSLALCSRVIRPLNNPAAPSLLASQGGNNLGHIIIVSLIALSVGISPSFPMNKILHHLMSSSLVFYLYSNVSEKEKVRDGSSCQWFPSEVDLRD